MVAEMYGIGLIPALLVLFLTVGLPLRAVVDALSRPARAFYAAGSNKTAWVLVLIVAFFLGLGFFLGSFYLFSVRRKVRLQMPAWPTR
jgi:hypothetical protein